MVNSVDVDRSIRRRLKQAGVSRVFVPGSTGPMGGVDSARTYQVGGVRKRYDRTATVIGEDGVWYETSRPRPGQQVVNGLSDTIERPVRVERSRRRSKSSRRRVAGIVR